MDMQQLAEFRQRVADSGARWKSLHEKRFGPITSSISTPIEPIQPLQLVIPPTFQAEVQKHHLSSRACEVLSRHLDNMLADYAQQFTDAWQKLTHGATSQLRPLLPKVIEKLRDGMQTHFETQGLPKLMAEVVEYAEKRPAPQATLAPAPPTRPYEPYKPFNNEYTPILQTYFQYDAFPSANDRQIIAERSGMTKRQIEVWFQNHRRIARQRGLQLKKRPVGAFVPANVHIPFLSSPPDSPSTDFNPNSTTATATESESEAEREKEKQRMLDMFNIHAPAPSPASSASTPAKATAGSGKGYTPDDPIQIDSSDEPNSGLGMLITYTPREAVGILQHVDDVDRMARNARLEELKEEREGFLSIIAPRYLPSSGLAVTLSSSTELLNPLTGFPEGTPLSSTFPAAFTLPPLEMQFRKLVGTSSSASSSSSRRESSSEESSSEVVGHTRPILPSPNDLGLWFRLAPPSSTFAIPPPTAATRTSSPKGNGKDKGRSGRKPAQKTKEELAKEKEAQAQFSADLALLEKRVKLWSLNDAVESGTIPTSASSSALTPTVTTKSQSSAKAKAKSILKALGVGIDAATCAYTSVLPKAPFWACVKVSTLATSGPGVEVDAMEMEMVGVRETTPTPSSGGKKMNASSKKQKPAALGPKRKPKNAPAASAAPAPSTSTSTFSSFSITSSHAKSKNGRGHSKAKLVTRSPEPSSPSTSTPTTQSTPNTLQRHGSNSSLSSSSSSETGTDSRPRTPVDGMDIPSMPSNTTRKAAFPLAGFTTVSPTSFASFEAYGVNVDMSTPVSVPVKQTQIPAPPTSVAAPVPAAPTPTPVQPSALAVAAPASVPSAPAPSQIPQQSQPQPQMQMHLQHIPTPMAVPDYAFGNPYSVAVANVPTYNSSGNGAGFSAVGIEGMNMNANVNGGINPLHTMHVPTSTYLSNSNLDIDLSMDELNVLMGFTVPSGNGNGNVRSAGHGYNYPQMHPHPQTQQGQQFNAYGVNPIPNSYNMMSMMGMGGGYPSHGLYGGGMNV